MSDAIDDFRALKQFRQKERAAYGRPCPVCVEKLPRAHPKILLPQQVCRMHRYRDPRPELTQQDIDAIPQGPQQP
jgi:hypothetical protein